MRNRQLRKWGLLQHRLQPGLRAMRPARTARDVRGCLACADADAACDGTCRRAAYWCCGVRAAAAGGQALTRSLDGHAPAVSQSTGLLVREEVKFVVVGHRRIHSSTSA